jgi:hypothetical protein
MDLCIEIDKLGSFKRGKDSEAINCIKGFIAIIALLSSLSCLLYVYIRILEHPEFTSNEYIFKFF